MVRRSPQKKSCLNLIVILIAAIIIIAGLGIYLNPIQASNSISVKEVLAAQNDWGQGVVQIGKTFSQGSDYTKAASDFIDNMYAYREGQVFFKPTLASKVQFRLDKEGALSYFVAGNKKFPEDHGFALKPWKNVRFENAGIKTKENLAIAMGNYYFTPANGEELKVEYTFAYTKSPDGRLKIILHDSHLPYTPIIEH